MFGMGTGGPSPQSTPTGVCLSDSLVIISLFFIFVKTFFKKVFYLLEKNILTSGSLFGIIIRRGKIIASILICECAGIGRQARLRGVCQ